MDGTLLNKKLKIEEKLAQLNEIAQKVDDMPVFTSNDRAFLEELPGFPVTDGKKVLTATTESGETSLAYEEVESGENRVYSTTPQVIGTWIDGKKVKRVVINLNSATTFKNDDWVQIPLSGSDYSIVINACAIGADGASCPLVVGRDSTNTVVLACRVDSPFVANTLMVEYVEAAVSKRSKK